jgi:hypothetical protein
MVGLKFGLVRTLPLTSGAGIGVPALAEWKDWFVRERVRARFYRQTSFHGKNGLFIQAWVAALRGLILLNFNSFCQS